jgi:type I restriction enzyme, S subunit
MTSWREKTLGEFVSLQRGHDLPTDNRGAGRVPVVGSFGVTGYHDKARAKGPGLTVGRSGASAGSVFFINEDFWPHNTCLFVTDFQGNNPRFAYYLLGTLNLPSHAAGSAQPSLNRNHISPLSIRVPERLEQDQIVRVLSALDDKIELNRRMNETLEAMAQAIFKDWFVDFGPVRRKLAGVTDPVAITGGLTPAPELAALFPDGFGDDGLPEGWNHEPVSEFADLSGGKQLDKSEIADVGPVPVFGGAGIMGYTNRSNARGYVVTVGRVGAYCGQFFAHRGEAWVNNNASLITSRKPDLAEWLFWALKNVDIDVIKKGAAQPFVSNGDIAKLSLVSPGAAILEAFVALLKPILLRREAGVRESETLAETRDYLLPKLMSGEVRVRDAERMVADAG